MENKVYTAKTDETVYLDERTRFAHLFYFIDDLWTRCKQDSGAICQVRGSSFQTVVPCARNEDTSIPLAPRVARMRPVSSDMRTTCFTRGTTQRGRLLRD